MKKIPFFVRYHGALDSEKNCEKHTNNLAVYYIKYISSPFLVYNMYMELMCRIAYNIADKEILPPFISELRACCRSFTACDHRRCGNGRKNRLEYILFKGVTIFCLCIIEVTYDRVDPSFVNMFIMIIKLVEIILI